MKVLNWQQQEGESTKVPASGKENMVAEKFFLVALTNLHSEGNRCLMYSTAHQANFNLVCLQCSFVQLHASDARLCKEVICFSNENTVSP